MTPVRLRFGLFEFDVRSGDLLKQGTRVHLQEQAAQVLLMLIEHPGEVVLRSEIREKLWPGDTVVDFDQSINSAVKRLRNALCESADAPRYIETVAKRGYRFIAEVHANVEAPPEPVAPAASPEGPAAAEAQPEIEPLARQEFEPVAPSPRRRTWPWLSAAAAALFIATGVYLELGGRSQGPPMRAVPFTTFAGEQNFPAFSPDGDKVAFCWVGPPRQDGQRAMNIYVKSILTGETVPVTSGPTDDRYPSWSPDGSQIAFQRRITATVSALTVVPSGGGAERKIADSGVGFAWSPDGNELAYVAPYAPDGNGGIVVRSLRTGAVRQLTSPQPHWERWVAWSPDGKQIAFSRNMVPVRELFVVPSQGGEARQLTFDRQITGGFAWTPDSRELVFDSSRQSGASLWRIRATGGTPLRVSSMANHPAFPSISVRGNRRVYSDFFVDSNIWQYELAGAARGADPLLPPPKCLICSTVEDDSPRFSPDGRRIAFVSWRAGTEELWTSNSDGSAPKQLTSLGGRTGSPRWSPDGRWIAFDSRAGGGPSVYVISAAGGAPRRVTPEPSVEMMPSWSHDGRWIYFASSRAGASHIWKAAFEGGPARQVTEGDGGECQESADGKRLYYFRREHDDGLWSVPVEGGLEEAVPELSGVRRTRAWTVRAEGIYFYQEIDAKPAVRFFDFATRRVSTLLAPEHPAAGGNPGIDISPDGRRLLYTQVDHRVDGLMMIDNFR
jgi:Tol biopolymer transport system component/DNA-binding winged helix-turn-helix (wHTH) protein